jgi:hypothetical protein
MCCIERFILFYFIYFFWKGDEGIGKNYFSNLICEVFKGYCLANVGNIGRFNDLIRGKVMIVLNEKENETRRGGRLWSLITESIVDIEAKYKNREMEANYCNFIICTNNDIPVKISPSDRRFFVLEVSDKRKDDFEYFENLGKEQTKQFFQELTEFLLNYNISNFNVKNIPFTFAKSQLIMLSSESLDEWVMEHFEELNSPFGMHSDRAFFSIPPNLTKAKFTKLLLQYCGPPKRVQRGNVVYKFACLLCVFHLCVCLTRVCVCVCVCVPVGSTNC